MRPQSPWPCSPYRLSAETAVRYRCSSLLLLLFLSAALLSHCASDNHTGGPAPEAGQPGYADLIVVGGKVWTGLPGTRLAEAVAIGRNRILAVGDTRAVLSWRGPRTTVLDAAGRSVIPGFHDAHAHLYYGSLTSLGLDLLSAPTLPLTVARVAQYAREHPEQEWIIGHGWYFDIMPKGRLPTREDLDIAVPDRPVVLVHMSGHYAWVNTEALRRAAIDEHTPDPPSGRIGRDPLTGVPNGLLFESAAGRVTGPALASIDQETRTEVLARKLGELASLGITSVDEIFLMPGLSQLDLSSYLALLDRGDLTCRIHLFLSGDLAPEEILSWKRRLDGDVLRVGGVKVFVDGNFQAHTAWLLEPYDDQPDKRGEVNYSQEALDTIARDAQCMGLPVKFHAIGDAAVRRALDAIEAAGRSCPRITPAHSIEHVELLDPQDLFRFASLGAVASVQPLTALFSTTAGLDALLAEVGEQRSGHLFPNRSLMQAGADLLFGTDWPAGPFLSPTVGIWSSLARPGRTSPDFGLPAAPHALSLEEALYAYTFLPAKALGLGRTLGTIEPGKLADIAVVSEDIFSLQTDELLGRLQVDLTLMDGTIVFARDGRWPEMPRQGR